jgi:hypothetical protein
MHRPLSLTIISWFLIVSGSLTILLLFDADTKEFWEAAGVNTLSMTVMNFISSVIYIVSGVLILKQNRIGRTLYVSWFAISVFLTLLLLGSSYFGILVFTILIYGIFLFFLYQKNANDYFDGVYVPGPPAETSAKSNRKEQINKSPLARVFGILCLGVSGFILLFGLIISEFPDIRSMHGLLFVFFGIPFLLFTLAGIFLWGWRRWAASTGWVLLSASSIVLMFGFMIYLMSGPEFYDVWGSDADIEDIEAIVSGSWNALFPF